MMPAHTPLLTPDTWQHQFAMEGSTTLLSSNTHFTITSNNFLPQPYTHDSMASMCKCKPIVTYQSLGSGVVDVGLLVHNTALDFEAAAVAAVIRGSSASASAGDGAINAINQCHGHCHIGDHLKQPHAGKEYTSSVGGAGIVRMGCYGVPWWF